MRKHVRDTHTGQFAYDGNFDRMCDCGHTLGFHADGGFDCLTGSGCPGDPHPGVTCDCRKFRQSRRRPRPASDAKSDS